ncbi:regulatory subunit of type II PKA R-subunit, partial [Ostertagia ostertagi]
MGMRASFDNVNILLNLNSTSSVVIQPRGMDVNLRYKVPDGLRPLLEALARETLRSQPKDIVRFAQLFFEELQHHR